MCSGVGRVNSKGFQHDVTGRPTVIYHSSCCICCLIPSLLNCGLDSADNRDCYSTGKSIIFITFGGVKLKY